MTRAHPIPEAAFDGHVAVLGTSGYGKTNAVKGAVERLLAQGRRVVVVDPTGVWWGLRLTAGGRRPSPYELVIFGGRHADLPLDAEAGAQLARVLGATTTPAILDTSQMTVAARTRFFIAFAEALLRENRGPLNLVIDEAHLFAPQAGGTGLVPDLLHATNNLVSLGRTAGLRVTLISQRPAKVHKDSLSQCPTLVVMGLIDPRDRKAAKDWLDGAPDQSRAREIMASLAGLPIGTGWIYAPRLGVLEKADFPLVSTFDSGRPEANADAPALNPLDVVGLREALASQEDGSAESQTAKARTGARQAAPADLAGAEQRGYERGLAEGLRRGGEFAAGALSEVMTAVQAALNAAGRQVTLAQSGRWALPQPSAPGTRKPGTEQPPEDPEQTVRATERRRQRPEVEGKLNGAGRKMLAVLDTDPPVRRSWQQVATLAGLKARGGHYNAGKKGLMALALVAEEGGLVRIVRPSAGAGPEATDSAALVEMWAGSLSGAAPRILRHLFAAGPDDRQNIADALQLQPRGGHWNAAWKELRDNGLIVERDGWIGLSDLFGGPRP